MNPGAQNHRRKLLLNLSVLPLIAAGLPAEAVRAKPRYGILGQPAPELEVDFWIDAQGEASTVRLQQYQGRWVYLYCFQDWCPGCHSHGFPTLAKLAQAFADESQIALLAVQTTFEGFRFNTQDKVRELQLKYKLQLPMGHDAGDPNADRMPRTMQAYRTGGTPWTVLISPQGQVVFNDYHIDADKLIHFLNQRLA